MGLLHSFEIFLRSENYNLIIMGAICLDAFKALNRIVQGCVCGVHLEGVVCHNLWLLPSSVALVVVDLQHVVCSYASK